MADLFDDPQPASPAGQNLPEFTVTELSGKVKRTLEDAFGRVRVRGEIGRVSQPRSGHVYFDLKDDRNVVNCTSWKGQVANLSVMPEEGLEVIVTGKLSAYGAQSRYNLNVDEIEVAGEGALLAMLEKRKKLLEAEGLFDPARKRPLPYLPGIIGVVTSPSGAVIRDILHRLRERFPRKVLIWPVAVQGKACAPEVVRAIEGFNAMTPGGALPRPDVLIVARGGGSVEDLWGFNEEAVARAAAASEIPLISAVGHETDTTLIDFVSDQRAPTPTAAAEMAVPVRLDLMAGIDAYGARMAQAMAQTVERRRQRLADLSRALPRPDALLDRPRRDLDRLSERLPMALERGNAHRRQRLTESAARLTPASLERQILERRREVSGLADRLTGALDRGLDQRRERLADRAARLSPTPVLSRLAERRERLDGLTERLQRAGPAQVARWREALAATDRLRETLSYKATLGRGYAVVRGADGPVTAAAAAATQTDLSIEFSDGVIEVAPKAG